MMIIGCDFHPSWQQVSWLDTETGETGEQKLVQCSGDTERFYRQVPAPALIGMEATGNCHWLVDLLADLGHELWVGDAAQIRASYVRRQKTDKRDAAHILKLLVEGRFPRIWMPSSEVRDLRQLLLHRSKLVMIRARVKNELQHLCLNKGMQRKHKLWSKNGQQMLRELPLKPWAGRRREDLLQLMTMLDQQIEPLDEAVKTEAQRDKMALLLQTQPGVGPITALAYVLTMGDVSRFPRGKQVASYLGLIPREHLRADVRNWAPSPSRAIACCGCCWWRRHKRRFVWIPSSAKRICIVVTRSRKQWPRWQRHASWRYDCTGCCAPTSRIQTSFASRAARGCPWSAQARPLN
jgi:transposase